MLFLTRPAVLVSQEDSGHLTERGRVTASSPMVWVRSPGVQPPRQRCFQPTTAQSTSRTATTRRRRRVTCWRGHDCRPSVPVWREDSSRTRASPTATVRRWARQHLNMITFYLSLQLQWCATEVDEAGQFVGKFARCRGRQKLEACHQLHELTTTQGQQDLFGEFTQTNTGCPCWFDLSREDCACCHKKLLL